MLLLTFNNYESLEQHLLKIIADSMNDVAKRVEDLLKQHVQTDVYNVGTSMGRKYYYNDTKQPTGQLKESVISTKPETKKNEVSSKIHHDSDKMEFKPDSYLHGSNFYKPKDVRDWLPYLINEGKTGDLFGSMWANLRRPYITNTYDELVSKDLIRKWMIEALKKRGLKIS